MKYAKSEDLTRAGNEVPTYVYRGVHPKHIKIADARSGIVTPGDPLGEMTPEEHNVLNESGCSPFTSWTYSLEVARRFAKRPARGGIVLRVTKDEPGPRDNWEWVDSPDQHNEQEVLLRGVRIGLEVLSDDE